MGMNERGHITIAGRDLADFGVYISGNGTYNAPERDIKTISGPGRSGDLTLDNGRFKNIKIKYPAFIVEDFGRNIDALRDFLGTCIGYQRIEDTYHPDEYRMGRVSGAMTVKPVDKLVAGKFDLTFDCMPQRWLKSGEDLIYGTGSFGAATSFDVLNPTQQDALPIIQLIMDSNCTKVVFNINDVQFTMNAPSALQPILIDSEMQNVYGETNHANLNSYLTLDDEVFPTLKSGLNTISFQPYPTSGYWIGGCEVNLYPRWWQL